MPGIFISYRRDDAAGHAGRLFDRLREHFGKDRVFMDVTGIEAGVDFVEAIEKAVGSCDVLLAVIGREWLTCTDKKGRRRLDDPNDFIGLEIATALKRNVRVIPILVEEAEMPLEEALPENLKRLGRRQAVELRDSRWDADVQDLVAHLQKAFGLPVSPTRPARRYDAPSLPKTQTRSLPKTRPPAAFPEIQDLPSAGKPEPRPKSRSVLWVAFGVLALVMAGLVYYWLNQSPARRVLVVPNVVGRPIDEAREVLARAGFKTLEVAMEPSSSASPGTVVRQNPPAGKRFSLLPGAERELAIELTVAAGSGEALVEVPDLRGLKLDEAHQVLAGRGLRIGRIGRKGTGDPGLQIVISQRPPAGESVGRGASVAVVVAQRLD